MTQEYSIDNKYQVFTLDLSNGLNNIELDTMVVSNFLTTFFIDNNTGKSVTNGIVNIAITASKNYGLTFLNGSKYKAQYQKLYVSAPAQPNISVRIFTSVNAFYEKEQPITNAVFEKPMEVVVDGGIDEKPLKYGIKCYSGNVNNTINSITVPQVIDGRTVKGISSIIISNLDNSHDLFFGNIDDIINIALCTTINAGEKFTIDFKPQTNSFVFTLASTNNVNYQYNILYSYTE